MSEQVSKELLKVFSEMADLYSKISKIDASIFVRNSDRIIKEKVYYLTSILSSEAKSYNQNEENHFEEINLIVTHYKQKLNMVYDEFYCQYVNIQNEMQEARLNREIGIINYQKLINDIENGAKQSAEINYKLKELKEKNEIYNKIIRKCIEKFGTCSAQFEQRINDEFLIATTSLQVSNQTSIFQKIIDKLSNIFNGKKKYIEILTLYNKKVDKIDSQELVTQMREETIDFVTELIELREFSNLDLKTA